MYFTQKISHIRVRVYQLRDVSTYIREIHHFQSKDKDFVYEFKEFIYHIFLQDMYIGTNIDIGQYTVGFLRLDLS